MEHAEYRDALTGLLSHTSFQVGFRQKVENVGHDGGSPGLALLDLDRFRIYNELQGHEAGDELLVWFTGLIKATLSPDETAGRFGGDEFALLLSGKKLEMKWRMEELCAQVAADDRPVTLSVGVAHFPTDARSAKDLLQACDFALYSAKRGGRNQVVASKTYAERYAKPLIDPNDGNSPFPSGRMPPEPPLFGGGAVRLGES